MPAKSAKQFNLMSMIAHGKGDDIKLNALMPDKKTAKKFVKETPKKKRSMFAKSNGKD